MMREIVKAKHIMLEFNGRDVLNISELSVAENERIGLIGANGSGKTSMLRILSGEMETATCKVVRYGNVLYVPQVSIEDSHHMVPTDYMASIWGVKNCELIHASGGEAARVRILRAVFLFERGYVAHTCLERTVNRTRNDCTQQRNSVGEPVRSIAGKSSLSDAFVHSASTPFSNEAPPVFRAALPCLRHLSLLR